MLVFVSLYFYMRDLSDGRPVQKNKHISRVTLCVMVYSIFLLAETLLKNYCFNPKMQKTKHLTATECTLQDDLVIYKRVLNTILLIIP